MEQKEIELVTADIDQIAGWVKPITDETSCKYAADNLKGIKIKIKDLETMKKSATGPAMESIKMIRSWFAPAEDKAEEIKNALTKNILEYQREQIRLQQIEEENQRNDEKKRLEKLALESDNEGTVDKAIEMIDKIDNAPSEVSKGVKSDWAKTIIKDKWIYEVVDPNLVPAHLQSPDHAKITAAIKAGERTIAGLKITNEGSLTSLLR
jgi:hypothetical protein